MELSAQGKSNFFGKDGLTPFIGTVEDCNDPKRAGRVKVRCVGWHPYEKEGDDGLATEDLPWARVSAPTTHAQQGRVGGKHGLLTGSWVFGFFLDGDDAQDPMVIGSFPFTAGVSDRDNRKRDEDGAETGTTNTPEGFDKTNSNPLDPNDGTRTKNERQSKTFNESSDKAGDAPALDDQTDGECGPRESLASENRMKQEYQKGSGGQDGNHMSQNYNISLGDGGIGAVAHAAEDIQKRMQEMIPGELNRFQFGDVVWENFTGSFLDMEGVKLQTAMELSGITAVLQLQSKAMIEDIANRTLKSTGIFAATIRDPFTSIASDLGLTAAHDIFHANFSSFLDGMPGQIKGILDGVLSDGALDLGSMDLTNSILSNIADLTQQGINSSQVEPDSNDNNTQTQQQQNNDDDDDDTRTRDNFFPDADELEEDNPNQPDRDNDDDDDDGGGGGGGGGGFDIGSILSGSGIGSILNFSMMEKYSIQGFNLSGIKNFAQKKSQDPRTQAGSGHIERFYKTNEGETQNKSNVGGASAGSGGGADSFMNAAMSAAQKAVEAQDKQVEKDKKDREKEQQRLNNIVKLPFDDPDDPRLIPPVGSGQRETTVYDPGSDAQYYHPSAHYDPSTGTYTEQVIAGGSVKDLTGSGINKSSQGSDINYIVSYFANLGFGGMRKDFVPSDQLPDDAFVLKRKIGQEPTEQEILDYKARHGRDVVIKYLPGGYNADAYSIALPVGEGDPEGQQNFREGVPNTIIIKNSGKNYYFPNPVNNDNVFPSIYIKNYNSVPVPVVDQRTGELVSIMTDMTKWGRTTPFAAISILPDESPVGILTNDPDYDIVVGAIHVANTGFNYSDAKVEIIDKDTGKENGKAKIKLFRNRIVQVEVIDPGTGFLRIPKIKIYDTNGVGAKLMPIMSVIPRSEAKPLPPAIRMIYCPSKNLRNE